MSVILQCPRCNLKTVMPDSAGFSEKYLCQSCQVEMQIVRIAAIHEQGDAEKKSSAYAQTIVSPHSEHTAKTTPANTKRVIEQPAVFEKLIANRYALIEKIGAGGMGTVYKAWDSSLKRNVAVKILRSVSEDPSLKEEAVARFVREAQTAAKLTHPNILQIFEVGEFQGCYYICMEYVGGGTLGNYWQKRQFKPAGDESASKPEFVPPHKDDIRVYLSLMVSAITAVDYAHQFGIIHRDIKPDNILLDTGRHEGRHDTKAAPVTGARQPIRATEDLIPKIADFGLAKEAVSDSNLTVAGTVVGTPVYMSPEQTTADKLDCRSDVFSLGSVLYKLCTGSDPFAGDSVIDIMKAVSFKDPEPPSRINRAVSRDVEVIILKAMEKERDRRYASACELADDIERYLRDEPIHARPASAIYRITKHIKRNRTAAAGIAAGLIIVTAVLVFLWVDFRKRKNLALDNLEKAEELYLASDWAQARDYYLKYLEFANNDPDAEKKMDGCTAQLRAAEEGLRLDAQKKEKASKDVQQAWLYANQVFPDFYKKNTNMEKTWKSIDDAILMLTQSIDEYPTAMGYLYRAMLYKEKGLFERAEKDLTGALGLERDFDTAYIIRGAIYFEEYMNNLFVPAEHYAEAQKAAREFEDKAMADFARVRSDAKIPEQFEKYKMLFEAMKMHGRDQMEKLKEGYEKYGSEEFQYWMGMINCSICEYNAALENANTVLDIKPQYLRAYILRGRIYERRKDYKPAIADYTRAMEMDPGHVDAYVCRGTVEFSAGNIDAAMDDFSEALRIKPDHAVAFLSRGVARLKKDDTQGALEDLDNAIRINPSYTTAYYDRGVMKYNQYDLDGAMADMNSALKITPDYPDAYNYIGIIKSDRDDLDGALKNYDSAIEIDARNAKFFNNRGFARQKKGDTAGAMDDYTKAIELDPEYMYPYFNRGIVRTDSGDLDGAVEDLDRAVSLAPDSAMAYHKRGFARYKRGEMAIAIKDFSEAIRLGPVAWNAYFDRGVARHKSDDLDGASADYDKTIELKQDCSDAYFNRGSIRNERKDAAGAIADFSMAIKYKPDFADSYAYRGKNKYDLGDIEGALEDFIRALQLEPGNYRALCGRGVLYLKKGSLDAAIADLTAAIKTDPQKAEAYYTRGVAVQGKGDLHSAFNDYNKALQIDPDYPEVYCSRGSIYYESGDLQAALNDFNTAIQLKPNLPDAYSNRANIELEMNKPEEAIMDYTKALELNPGFTAAWYNMGLAKAGMKDFDAAMEDFNSAIKTDASFAPAYFSRGRMHAKKNDLKTAIADYTEAIRLQPDFAQAIYSRGMSYYTLGNYEQALADMERAVALDPGMKPQLDGYIKDMKNRIGQ